MYCPNCGSKLADGAAYCSRCGFKIERKNKNLYIAWILTFFISGLGSIYAGKVEKGLKILALRIIFASLGVFLNVFFALSFVVWAYSFYAAYKDIEEVNGRPNPNPIEDFRAMNRGSQIIAVILISIILIFTFSVCFSLMTPDTHSSDDSKSHYYSSGSSSGGSGSSHSSKYGGVDTSPRTIAKDDPDWFYEYYDYGDYDKIDEYLESQGYD